MPNHRIGALPIHRQIAKPLLPATFDEDDGDWFCEDVYAVTTYDFNDLGLGAVG